MTKLSIILLSISLSSIGHAGNSVFIEQITTSDDTTITVNQDGNNNAVNLSMAHDDNTLDIDQKGNNNTVSWTSTWGSGKSWGGDLDGTNNNIKTEQNNTTGSDSNKVGFHIQSNDNNVNLCQGATFASSTSTSCSGTSSEYGGHTINIDLHSGGNDIKIGQQTGTGNADHYVQLYTYGGENNNTFVTQEGDGNKTLNMTIRTDGGEQELMQKGDGAHAATIDLTGSYHTDLDLVQQGSTNQSYSLTQDCQTSVGCGVSVTQGN
jgi:hypothetical protein|tara:strand:+ start:883 stop:1674 length:792 start_codon:yes stop_codon:yes gene_type:complete